MRLFRTAAALATLLLSVAFCCATEAVAKGGELWVNDIRVARFIVSVGAISPANRAQLAASRLAGAASAEAQGPYVLIDGTPIYAAAEGDAKAAGVTPSSLAMTWAKQLNAALQIPALKLDDEFVTLPVGGLRTLRVSGVESKGASVKTDNPGVAKVQRTAAGVLVRAMGLGRTTISVQGATAMETVDVQVKPLAANLPKSLAVEVTGAPAIGSTVQGAIASALREGITGVPGMKWKVGPIRSRSIESGTSLSVPVRVTADGPDAFPATGVVSVNVKNVPLSRLKDESLWYSNDPETIKQPEHLFAATLKKGTAARLLYHHMNGTINTLFLRVQAVNDSDVPARVVITPGDSTPNKNPVTAGLEAGSQYVKGLVTGSADIMTIPAHSSMPICLRRLGQYDTASGLCSIRLLDGPDGLLVRTDAFPPFNLDSRWSSTIFSSTPWREVGASPITEYDRAPMEASLHIYPDPYKTMNVAYEVGGRYGFVRLGQMPIQRQDSGGGLDGNFGVLYTIKTKLQNPTAKGTDVEIVFEASAGYASAIFVLNGRTIIIPQLAPKTEKQVTRIHLAPGQTENIDILTMPLSGGAYPATITIRPILDATFQK